MRVVVVNAPDPVVSWEEAQAHLRLDGDAEKAVVEGMIAAATAHIDGPSGWLGRAIGMQELEVRFSLCFHGRTLRLPYPPVAELISVKYLGADNVERTADIEDFDLFDGQLGPEGSEWIWLGGSMREDAGRIRYRAGYAEVPAAIKAAVLLMVGDLHRFRSSASDMNITPTSIPMAAGVNDLLQPFRVYAR